MNTRKLNSENSEIENIDISSLWAESMQDENFRFEIKAQSVAVDLARATSELGLSQAEVAERLNWSPSRVSRVLHGSTNITLRTLFEFSSALNLDFDVIYRAIEDLRTPQPWEAKTMLDSATAVCKKIEQLHNHAQENLTQSRAILETASALNRKTWQLATSAVPTKKLTHFKLAA